ncbi:MAG: hypothetical protein HUU15_05035 [Candidatus Brocadiae bacterium]|nr:hypothetical protein [Candidatus Brocadiia bacterium]
MSLVDRIRSIRKRWWLILGLPAVLFLCGSVWLLVKWVQYRTYVNVDLAAILPGDAEGVLRVQDLAGRWPAMAKSPALIALASGKNPGRAEGPLSLEEAAGLLGGTLPPEATEGRVFDLAGRDFALAVKFTGGRQDVVAATRVPFHVFLLEPIIRRSTPDHLTFEFRGDILIAGTRADWVAKAAERAETGESGPAALELAAASPDGDPAFWLDLAAVRKDPEAGPKLREWFHSVPVREGLFMLEYEAARSVSGRLVFAGADARLEGSLALSARLPERLQKMYALPGGGPGLSGWLPLETCYATGGRFEARTTWEFLKELSKSGKASGKRRTVSRGFGEFVEGIYVFVSDGIQLAEEHRSDQVFRDLFDREAVIVMTPESADPYLGLTILARVTDSAKAQEQLFQFFTWLHEGEGKFRIVSDTYRGLDLRVLEGSYDVLGAGVKPAYTVIDGVLVLSSSVATVKAIADVRLGGAPGFAGSVSGTALMAAAPADGPAWAYVDAVAFRSALEQTKSQSARAQVERDIERMRPEKLRAKLTEEHRARWEAAHPGRPWVAAEHTAAIDQAWRDWVASEEARVAAELSGFASRLARIRGVAFTVRQGPGDTLEWRAILSADP